MEGKVRPIRNGKSYVTLNGKEISSKVTVDTTDVSTSLPFFQLWNDLFQQYFLQTLIYGGHAKPSKIVGWDVPADNGLIHVVDEVFIPYEGSEAPLHN